MEEDATAVYIISHHKYIVAYFSMDLCEASLHWVTCRNRSSHEAAIPKIPKNIIHWSLDFDKRLYPDVPLGHVVQGLMFQTLSRIKLTHFYLDPLPPLLLICPYRSFTSWQGVINEAVFQPAACVCDATHVQLQHLHSPLFHFCQSINNGINPQMCYFHHCV